MNNVRKNEKSEWEDDEEEGGTASLNRHIAALRTILMTYHTFSPELGYVQGQFLHKTSYSFLTPPVILFHRHVRFVKPDIRRVRRQRG